jgi:hypothetical protein
VIDPPPTAATSLAPRHEDRVGLWQLDALLVHVCLVAGG